MHLFICSRYIAKMKNDKVGGKVKWERSKKQQREMEISVVRRKVCLPQRAYGEAESRRHSVFGSMRFPGRFSRSIAFPAARRCKVLEGLPFSPLPTLPYPSIPSHPIPPCTTLSLSLSFSVQSQSCNTYLLRFYPLWKNCLFSLLYEQFPNKSPN